MEKGETHTDHELLIAISHGDKDAFRKLFDLYYNRTYSIAMKFTGNREASEDALQDIFTGLWTHRASLAEVENFNAYLNTVIRNHMFNYLRKIANQQALLHRITPGHNSDKACEITHNLDCKELNTLVHCAVEQLPPQQKKAYTYSRISGMKQQEIADTMGISRSTVKGHLTEALRHIREVIHKSGETEVIVWYLLLFLFYSPFL